MASIAFVLPLLPEKTEAWRRFSKEVVGPRLKEMSESRQRANDLTRETTWIEQTPQGDLLIVYLEGSDPLRSNQIFVESKAPFDLWFKKEVLDMTGVDFNQPPPSFPKVYETQVPSAKSNLISFAIAFPIVPGKTEEWRRWAAELTGPRRGEFEDYLQRAGLAKENWYLQQTPQGDLVIFYVEGENPGKALQDFATSDHPFDIENRQRMREMHGIDFSAPSPGPLPELAYDWQKLPMLKPQAA